MSQNKEIKRKYKNKLQKSNIDANIKDILEFYNPLTEEELLQIKGIDQKWMEDNKTFANFVEKLKYEHDAALNAKTKNILLNFSKKLASFSQQNKMIWVKKPNIKHTIDLTLLEAKGFSDALELINDPNSKKKVKLKIKNMQLDKHLNNKIKDKIANYEKHLTEQNENNVKGKMNNNKKILFQNANYDYFTKLIKEDLDIQKERGQEQLYLANYFLEGTFNLNDNEIALRAPIFLFPIKISKNDRTQEITIINDHERDIIPNTLILNNILKTKDFDYNYKKEVLWNVKAFLKDLNYQFDEKMESLSEKKLNDIKYELGYKLKNHLVLGIFKIFDNSIQEEIKEIIETKKINKNILETFSEYDIYNNKAQNLIEKEVLKDINDDESIFYIDKLNFQQAIALKKINHDHLNHLTIWGPPGTGKSQTILSIIIDALIKNKRVAVVAEKKVALDVIYERLGALQAFSLLITDTNKKGDFYKQIRNTFEVLNDEPNHKEFTKIDYTQRLKNKLKNIDEISLFESIHDFGDKSLLEVFSELQEYKLSDLEISQYFKYKTEMIRFNNISYKSAFDVFKFVEERFTLDSLKDFLKLNNKYLNYQNYDDLQTELAEKIDLTSDLIKTNQNNRSSLEALNQLIFEYKKIGFFAIFKRRKARNEIFAQTYLSTKKEIKKFNQEQELAKLLEENGHLQQELIWNQEELEIIKYNKQNIIDYKKMDENQINWLGKIIDYNKKIDDAPNHLGIINKVILNFLIEKLIIEHNNFKFNEVKVNNWSQQIQNIDEIQEDLAKYNRNLVLETTKNNFLGNINVNERAKTIEKIANHKKQKSIYSFMNDYGLEIKNSYPVWLIRPEVLANSFKNHEKFDIILVDEASQLFVEQGLPTLQHSKKIVVLGDEKQLSPSSFFQNRSDDDLEETNYIERDDSLLDFAKTKFPSVMLKNHYRSHFSELIGYSNIKFYNNKLIATNNNTQTSDSPITNIFVENGVFENSINKNEAQEVLQLIKKLSKDSNYKDKTLGIITMNNSQKEYIDTLITNKQKNDLALNKFVKNSNLFIKSIENVQGDERDIIIFTSTYGLNKEGVMTSRFGPINNQGGENRINVAITRSKLKMFVVTSFDPFELLARVQKAKNVGPKVFAEFLIYSLNPSQWLEDNSKKEVSQVEMNETAFIESIYKELKRYIFDTFKYELIKNPEGNYGINYIVYDPRKEQNLLGIEVDIKAFNESKYARERDLSKMQYLNSRGWKLYRLWTINWFKNKDKEIEKIIFEINKIKRNRYKT